MATTYNSKRHDIGILRADGSTKVGLMLARDRNDIPYYAVDDDEFLSSQFFSGTPGYGNLPPEKELALRQDDWRSGFGLEVYDTNAPTRYFSSIGMDLRFRDMAILGPKAESISAPAPNWARPTGGSGWTNSSNAYDDDTGTYAHTTISGSSWSGYLELTIDSTNIDGVRYWVATESADINRIDVDLYYEGEWHHLWRGVPVTGSWVIKPNASEKGLDPDGESVTETKAVTKTRIRMYNSTGGAKWARVHEVSFLANTGGTPQAIVGFKEFNGELYIACTTLLTKLNATGDGYVHRYIFDDTITSIESFTDDQLYIAQGADTDYWYMSDGEGFTQSDSRAFFFCTVGTTLWKALKPRSIYSATNPILEANWSGVTTVDTSAYNITSMLSFDNALYILKEDRPFYLASGVVMTLTNITRPGGNSTSGKNSLEWQGKLYMPWGEQALLERDGGTYTWRDPSLSSTNLGDFVGRIQALGADEQYLFAIVDNSTKIEVLAGRLETVDGTTLWVWHPIQEITLTNCETAFVSSIYQKRLWIASDTSSENLHYIPLPTGYGDITNDGNRNFLTDGYFETPFLHGNFRGDDKAYIKIIAELGHAYDADIYYECHYKKFEDSSWTDAGNLIGSATNRIATLFFPADGSGNNPVSTMFKLKFVGKTDDVTKTPILKGYDIRAVLYPARRRIIKAVVRAADHVSDRQGVKLDTDAAKVKTVLEEAADATWPVTFYDIDGSTTYVRLLSASPFRRVIRDEKSKNLESWFYLTAQEVGLS